MYIRSLAVMLMLVLLSCGEQGEVHQNEIIFHDAPNAPPALTHDTIPIRLHSGIEFHGHPGFGEGMPNFPNRQTMKWHSHHNGIIHFYESDDRVTVTEVDENNFQDTYENYAGYGHPIDEDGFTHNTHGILYHYYLHDHDDDRDIEGEGQTPTDPIIKLGWHRHTNDNSTPERIKPKHPKSHEDKYGKEHIGAHTIRGDLVGSGRHTHSEDTGLPHYHSD